MAMTFVNIASATGTSASATASYFPAFTNTLNSTDTLSIPSTTTLFTGGTGSASINIAADGVTSGNIIISSDCTITFPQGSQAFLRDEEEVDRSLVALDAAFEKLSASQDELIWMVKRLLECEITDRMREKYGRRIAKLEGTYEEIKAEAKSALSLY